MARMMERKVTGPASAAMVAAGIGTLVIGLATSLTEASAGLSKALTWSAPVGNLSGKTGVSIIAWVLAWLVLHTVWKKKDVDLGRTFRWALALIALGFLLTFPPVFTRFAP